MQPTLPQSAGAADMDLPAVQSMDWLLKKERIYLLAQFWQQRATLAEKEVNTLKEQLSATNSTTATTTTTTATPKSITVTTTAMMQNGIPPLAPSPPTDIDAATNLSSKLINNNTSEEINENLTMEQSQQSVIEQQIKCEQLTPRSNSRGSRATTPLPAPPLNAIDKEIDSCLSNNNNSCPTSTRTIVEELAVKDKEIATLIEEVARLRSALAALQESHNLQLQRFEERIDAKRQHISKLESRLDKKTDFEIVKKENSVLIPIELPISKTETTNISTSPTHSEHNNKFQELLLERTKALTAQTEALKLSSSSDGSASAVATPLHLNINSNNNNNNSNSNNIPPSSPCTPIHIPVSTPISIPSNQCNTNQGISNTNINNLLPPPLQNVETFGSFLGEEIVSNWRRGLELPPPPPNVASLRSTLILNHHVTSPPTDGVSQNCHQQDDKRSHHDNSSTASTPVLQESRLDENMNGVVTTPMIPISKSPIEDNNNTINSLSHSHAGFMPGQFPFQFQDRGHFRFAEDLQMPPGSMIGRLGESLIPKGDPMEAKLQEMLRYNMDKYANQNLDTLHISRRVRELLSVHNIGQRLFAKYILGLSQGTVSELLSKPKPWDKLTEKGRDSYRKMHAWGCDDNAVMLLKSLIPKKGKDSTMPQYGRADDNMTDERIVHILSEASNLMKNPNAGVAQHRHSSQDAQHQMHQRQMQEAQQQHQLQQMHIHQDDSQSNDDSKSPHNQCISPFSKESSQNRKLKKYENDDIPQEKVARIYQEELAKLMTRAPRDAFPSGGMPPASNQMPEENIRMALEAYHRELMKLQQTGGNLPNFPNFPNLPSILAMQQQAINGAQDLSLPKEKQIKMNGQSSSIVDDSNENSRDSTEENVRHSGSAFSLVRPKQEPSSTPTTTASSAPSPLGSSILPPAITPTEDFSSAASPLQRMASITNSLITQPPVTPHHSQPQRPLKAVLPPITQQQFDMFNNLNTEDIVRRVKEALSQYSISQRLFGESVLGLSQGSVSDLLARPKPWHMLTQKGREPFIRMKMFLEDENAVHKLVASQYKIAPEKLMRTGNYSGSPQIPSAITKQIPPMPKIMSDNIKQMQQDQQHIIQIQGTQIPHVPTTQHQGLLLTPPGIPPHHAIPIPSQEKKPPMPMPVHSPQQNNAMRSLHQHMSPTVYEMAALTQDLDTQVITTKIKEALLANNIGQKIFGEAVLGLSQGSVSELLSKPKPWHMLSIKGREPFIRMQLWLSDGNNVDRLQALKNERREANKRRRSTGPGGQDNSSDTSSNDTSEFYHSNSPGPGSVGSVGAPPSKKQRVLFSEEQKEALRLAFALDPYPNVATIEFLATELGLATRTITNWFHNHRMRLKQQVPHGAPNEPVPTRESQSGTQFDPVQFRILLNQRLMELQKERIGLSGMSLPYPPYFAANPNLAALIGRGLLPTNEAELSALNTAFKEQMSGLDLSMTSLKREGDDDFDEMDGDGEADGDNDADGADSHISDNESLDGMDIRNESKDTPVSHAVLHASSRSSRRKPVAPQWVNPEWQDDKKPGQPDAALSGKPSEKEVIINGVCVMQQTPDYSRADDVVHVEPTPVSDRFDQSAHSDEEEDEAPDSPANSDKAASEVQGNNTPNNNCVLTTKDHNKGDMTDVTSLTSAVSSQIKKEIDDEQADRWEY